MKFNKHPQVNTGVRNLCAVVAISIALPALTHAKDIDWGKGDKGEKGDKWDNDDKGGRGEKSDNDDKGGEGHKGDKGDPRVSSVPEANTAWVLLPFVGAVLLFSARNLFPKKATE
jgi:hypothetical protein